MTNGNAMQEMKVMVGIFSMHSRGFTFTSPSLNVFLLLFRMGFEVF